MCKVNRNCKGRDSCCKPVIGSLETVALTADSDIIELKEMPGRESYVVFLSCQAILLFREEMTWRKKMKRNIKVWESSPYRS